MLCFKHKFRAKVCFFLELGMICAKKSVVFGKKGSNMTINVVRASEKTFSAV